MSIHLLDKGASSEISKDGYALNLKGIESWLKNKRIIEEGIKLKSYEDIGIWQRGGAETYFSILEIILENEVAKRIVLKAIISIPPEESLKSWSKRRDLLAQNKVPVSNWYWWGCGTIVEDYYPYTYDRIEDFSFLIDIAAKLDNLGFTTLNFLSDIRCDELLNPYYIDFGFDLGEHSNIRSNKCIDLLKEKYPNRVVEITNYLRKHYGH